VRENLQPGSLGVDRNDGILRTPSKLLIWSAVLNGIVAVPIMTVMMVVVTRLSVMGRFSARRTLTFFGWAGTALMAVTAVALFWSSIG
jgi:Mn2+/Fe2+ NRAMP family transporter